MVITFISSNKDISEKNWTFFGTGNHKVNDDKVLLSVTHSTSALAGAIADCRR